MSTADANYWSDYDGLQYAKHQLLKGYLGGWFPILSKWNGQVLYIDCHAGRGRHETGHEGSPLLAIKLLLEHHLRDRILSTTRVRFIFFEINQTNCEILRRELAALGKLPHNIKVDILHQDYENELRKVVAALKTSSHRLAPSFAFVDPYGFLLSMDLLRGLLEIPQFELLINFMYRYVDMAMQLPSQEMNLDGLFGCQQWRKLAAIQAPQTRAEETVTLFVDQLQTDFATHMYLRGANGALKYVLIHASNHRKGRELMKQALWSVTPDGSFTAQEHHHPDQGVLITPDPDLRPLEARLWKHFGGKQVRMEEIYDWLLEEPYLRKHLHQVLRKYRRRKIVTFTDYGSRFSFGSNPMVEFKSRR